MKAQHQDPSPLGPPMVAIVGRPNVGKSTLFNRFLGRRTAIVSPVPGTTRDRLSSPVQWMERRVILVDTGGLEPRPESGLWEKVKAQVEMAMAEAEVILFLTDVKEGVTPMDQDIAHYLRRMNKPVILAVNKADNEKQQQVALEFHSLGLGEPIPISAYHNLGIEELKERILERLPPPVAEPPEEEEVPKLAIVGRPNVGKSLLLNAILGQERAVVSPLPGTTRDAVDTLLDYQGQSVVLIDTAGVRRRGRVRPGIERYSVLRALRAIERCDVALLVMDAAEGVTAQDLHIGGYIFEAYKGMILVMNKWDLVAGRDQAAALDQVRRSFRFAPYAPVRFTSALKREGVQEVLATALEVCRERKKKIPAEELWEVVVAAMAKHPPPPFRGKGVKVFGAFQEGTNPPTFVFQVDEPQGVHFSYERYLENAIRSAFGFQGNHLKLSFRKG